MSYDFEVGPRLPGESDDAPRLQRAIDLAARKTPRRERARVFVDAGEHVLNTPLHVPDHVAIVGPPHS